MSVIDGASVFVSFLITWSIGLLPPVFIRYAFVKHPLAKWPAIAICALFWVINILLFTALGSQSKTHTALLLVAFVSYWIFRLGPTAEDLTKDREKTEQLLGKIR